MQNIKKLYLLNLLAGIVFWYPIEKLFMQQIGISPFGISVNAVLFILVLVLLDVPSGVLADKWKRKYVLLLAFVCMAASSFIGSISQNLVQYSAMTVLLGLFVVLTSGTFQAIMYDSLRDIDQQKRYDRHQGYSYALFLAGLGVSSVAGGYIADDFSYRLTYGITAVIMIMAGLLCLSLSEPYPHRKISDKKLLMHVSDSLKQITSRQLLLQLGILLSVMGILRSTQNEYAALYFVGLGLGVIPIGYATAGKWLVSSLGQIIAPKIGRKVLRLTPVFFACFLLFSLIHSTVLSLVFFYGTGLLYAMLSNQAEAEVQDNTASEVRATTLSLLSFTSNIILIPLGLLFGYVASQRDIFDAYLLIAVIGTVYAVYWSLRARTVIRM